MKKQPWQEVAIDGDTLEKRRDQRKEQLLRFIERLSPEDRRGISGTVNQWTKETGTHVVPASQSLYDLEAAEKKLRPIVASHQFEAPPITKRTTEERLDSMTKRLLASRPEEQEYLLRQVASEYWKAGAPVTVDALRTAAAHYLNRAERKAN
jgi:hypothetical protein